MLCPRCEDVLLAEVDRQGVIIDLCKKCRGVWLDRGELEKLMAAAAPEARDDRPLDRGEPRDGDRRDGRDGRPKRRGLADLLGDIFD